MEALTERGREVVALNTEQHRQRHLVATMAYQLVERSVLFIAAHRRHAEAAQDFARQNANEAAQISRARREVADAERRVYYLEQFATNASGTRSAGIRAVTLGLGKGRVCG